MIYTKDSNVQPSFGGKGSAMNNICHQQQHGRHLWHRTVLQQVNIPTGLAILQNEELWELNQGTSSTEFQYGFECP